MINILTSISLEKTVQSSLQLDVEKSRKKRHSTAKLTIEAVKQYVESFGYKLLSTQYVSVSTKLEIICPQNHNYRVRYNSFQEGARCAECNGNAKYRLSNVKAYIESFGYRLRSTAYLGANAKLDLVCPNQHMYRASFHVFQQGKRCLECSGKKKLTVDKVRQHIESFQGYQLLSNVYRNSSTKLEIICPKSHTYFATYHHFQRGVRCPECDDISKRRTMLNGEDWKPALRNSTADIAWRKAVKKRDTYTCQACFYPSKEIHAHHIESFARNPELQTDLNNGVTLCEPCHRELHSQYGMMTATRQNLAEFTRLKCR